jgi:excisionase family DNA binding protein
MVKKQPERQEQAAPIAYSVRDAARASGLGRSTLYELMANGQLAYVKVKKRRLITHQAIEALLEHNRAAA